MEKIIYKAPNHPGQHMPDVFIMAQPGMAAKYRAQRSHQGSTGNHQKQARESDMTQPPVALVDVVQCKFLSSVSILCLFICWFCWFAGSALSSYEGSWENGCQEGCYVNLFFLHIVLASFLLAYEIFQTVTGRGFDGKVARPARADLEALFNTSDEQAIAEEIIMKGEIQQSHV